ncbi:MAG: bifunctional aldolase/short-chain dehydrogenase [Planctomycetota bacterium]|jgi:rhamnose utilization protein RhaD (predicted bifunctional aldolase and dehydrogenase)/NAD(P)-dependent dehydrogenase (short-subunit alcohol dehydrogenase family)
MDSRWSNEAADEAIRRWSPGSNDDVAVRTYTTRLLGGDPRLVLHGGGNTSVKTVMPDQLGRDVDVICVKGSGWDMGAIEPPGLPAVRLEPLRELLALDALTDEDMVNACRTNLLDAASPTPSVETLLHAFLPHKFIDHTHANAVLSLTDQANGAEICREVYGDRAVVLPYIQPGFELAKRAWAAEKEHPGCAGMILVKHGIFSFADDAREAYERMIELVSLAEERIARAASKRTVTAPAAAAASPAEVAPVIRGLLAGHEQGRRFILDHRDGDRIGSYLAGDELARYANAGVVTPDHSIRTKPKPLILPAPGADFAADAKAALDAYVAAYRAYFAQNNEHQAIAKTALDPLPRVILVPGVGLFGAGATAKAAAVAADLAETTVDVITDAETIGRFESLTDAEIFEMEYWSLEQAKLGKAVEPRLARTVVVVTGGAGTIGFATGRAFRALGAEVALLDLDADEAARRADELGGFGVGCDVTNREDVHRALGDVCARYGGVDVVVSGAGAAWQGTIGSVSDEVLRRSFELNFFAHQLVASEAVAVMLAQGVGGTVLFNVSKQAVNPGRDFGPYGLPKAAALALMRQYAVDYGHEGIRANAVNADRIRSGLLTDDMIAERATARRVSEDDYMRGNLLQREVTAEDVADAFVALALAPATTGAVITVDGGNIAAALR